MSKRLTDTTKWDDDWFLSLPPRYKCVWEYMRDTCGGTGIKKVSLKKFTDNVGEVITLEEFNRHFEGRIHWINEETVWIHGFLKAQYKTLSAKNQAHVNIAKLIIREVSNQVLSVKAQAVFDQLISLVKESSDPHASLARPSDEAQAGLIGNRIKDKGKRKYSSKGGVGENKTRNEYPPEFEEFWKSYPRAADKSDAFKAYEKNVQVPEEVPDLRKAVANFNALMELEGREKKHIKHPSTFLNERRWRDMLDPQVEAQLTLVTAKNDPFSLIRGEGA